MMSKICTFFGLMAAATAGKIKIKTFGFVSGLDSVRDLWMEMPDSVAKISSTEVQITKFLVQDFIEMFWCGKHNQAKDHPTYHTGMSLINVSLTPFPNEKLLDRFTTTLEFWEQEDLERGAKEYGEDWKEGKLSIEDEIYVLHTDNDGWGCQPLASSDYPKAV